MFWRFSPSNLKPSNSFITLSVFFHNCVLAMADPSSVLESLIPNQLQKPDLEADEASNSKPGLRRSLSLIDGISLLVGTIVGSGIFTSPGVVLQSAGSVGLGLTAWVAASFLALCSSLVYAELGAAIPKAGGNVEFLKMAFGDAWGFAFLWTKFWVNKNGSLAIVAITFSRYIVAGLTGVENSGRNMDADPTVKAAAVGCVAVLTIWNCFGVHVGAKLQNVISTVKLLLVSILVVAALGFLRRNPRVLEENAHHPFEGSKFSGFGVSCVAALWAFSGWGDLVFMAEELKEPERNIPRGTVGGIFIVMVIYLVLNVIYLCILPAADFSNGIKSILLKWMVGMAVVKTSAVVAIDATNIALGPWAGSFMSILIATSVLGSANGIIIYGARYLYAAARQGQIFKPIGALGANSRAPYVAYLLQGFLCILLLLQSSNFVKLVSFLGVSSFFFYGITGVAHIKLRRDLPDLHRPYTVAFFPYAPLIVVCFCLYLVVSALIAQPVPTCVSLGVIISSFPVYYLFIRQP